MDCGESFPTSEVKRLRPARRCSSNAKVSVLEDRWLRAPLSISCDCRTATPVFPPIVWRKSCDPYSTLGWPGDVFVSRRLDGRPLLPPRSAWNVGGDVVGRRAGRRHAGRHEVRPRPDACRPSGDASNDRRRRQCWGHAPTTMYWASGFTPPGRRSFCHTRSSTTWRSIGRSRRPWRIKSAGCGAHAFRGRGTRRRRTDVCHAVRRSGLATALVYGYWVLGIILLGWAVANRVVQCVVVGWIGLRDRQALWWSWLSSPSAISLAFGCGVRVCRPRSRVARRTTTCSARADGCGRYDELEAMLFGAPRPTALPSNSKGMQGVKPRTSSVARPRRRSDGHVLRGHATPAFVGSRSRRRAGAVRRIGVVDHDERRGRAARALRDYERRSAHLLAPFRSVEGRRCVRG